MEGLEATEIMLSEVRSASDKLRIDSAYFAKAMLEADQTIRDFPSGYDDLGALFDRFAKGIFDINADTYVEEGIPFLRIQNLKDGLIDERGMVFIPEQAHSTEKKTELRSGDIVLSKTAYPAASLVTLDRCNTSQDTIATRLSVYGSDRYRAPAVVAYLNSNVGQALLWRQFQGNVQLHLSLEDGRKIPIPKFSKGLQAKISECFEGAVSAKEAAKRSIDEAEQALLQSFGLETWTPPDVLTYVRSSSEIFAAGRYDAEYYHPAKAQALVELHKLSDASVSDFYRSCRDTWKPTDTFATPVRNHDLTDALEPFLDSQKPLTEPNEIGSVKKRVKPGDLVVSRLRSYLREIAMVLPGDGAMTVVSTEFIVMRSVQRTPLLPIEALLVYLRSLLPQLVFKWSQDGSNHPRFDERELLNLPVPRVLIADQSKYVRAVRIMIDQRQRSTQLLDAAKRAVEIAIEEGEAQAARYLTEII